MKGGAPRVFPRSAVCWGSVLIGVAVILPLVTAFGETLTGDVAGRWAALSTVVLDRMVDTAVLAAGTTLIALIFALPTALCLHRADFPGRKLLGVLYVAPLLIPPHIHAISWLRILGKTGYVAQPLRDMGIPFDVRAGVFDVGGAPLVFPGAMWMMAAAFWPLAALVISAGLKRLDPGLEEAALATAGRRRTLLRVTLPLLKDHILAGAFFVFLFAAACHGIPALLDTPTIMLEVFFTASNVDPSTALVVATPLVVVALSAFLLVALGTGRRVWGGTVSFQRTPDVLRPRSNTAFLIAFGTLALTAGWPLASLIAKAGPFSTYQAVFKQLLPELTNSFQLAVVGGLLVMFAGFVVALCLLKWPRRRAFTLEAIYLLPLAFPAVVVGVASTRFWGRLSGFWWVDEYIYQGMGISLFTYLMMFLPFSLRCLRATMNRMGDGVLEAAELTGRGGGAICSRIILPLVWPGVMASFLISYVLILGELSASLVVNSARWQTAEVRIFNMIHFARDEEVAALCIMMAGLALLPFAFYLLVFNKKVQIL